VEPDGRRARRERGRQAVVEAAFALILEGKAPPSAQDVADRAGVSVSSVFRNFDGLADLQRQALDQFHSRYSHFASARPAPGADLVSRIGFFVRTRVGLYEQAGQLLMLARFRALDHETMAEAVAYNRAALAAQTRECFRAEIAGRTVADASDLLSLLDSLTSPEAFELMTRTHRRSPRQISRSWRLALRVFIAGWPPATFTLTKSEGRSP
jgi:AcrR family transcriptional regulator